MVKGKMFGTVVEPYPPDEVIEKDDELICIWRECPNIFGRYSEWKVIVTKEGKTYVEGEGGSEHYPLTFVALKIAKERGFLDK